MAVNRTSRLLLQNYRSASPPRAKTTSDSDSAVGSGKFGLTLQNLTADAAARLGLDASDQGLLVTRINPAGAAANAGIRQGDLIQEVNRQTG